MINFIKKLFSKELPKSLKGLTIVRETHRWGFGWGFSPHKAQPQGTTVQLSFLESSADDFEKIEYLVSVAMKDFPYLQKKDIQVFKYGGPYRKDFTYICFQAWEWAIPSSYEDRSNRPLGE